MSKLGRHFGGSCRYVVLDNLKEGVLKPDLYEPQLNPVYAATLVHYGVVGDPARVRDPNRKGSVEHAIGHTQATALRGRRFESIKEQNTFLAHWEAKWAASRIHGIERRQVQAMFDEEGPHLQPLPVMGMQYFTEAQRTVCDDSCVRVDHSSYAARPAPIGTRVLVRVFEHRIEIRELHTQALLRSHPRAERPGTVVLPAEERVFNPSRETRRILAQARAIGADASRLCELLFAIEGRVGQRKLWGIVSLAERYPRSLVNSGCARALADGIYSYRHVKAATEQLVGEALAAIDHTDTQPTQGELALTQEHPLMQAQSTQEPFLDTFAAMLQDELDRRRSRLTERRFKQSRLDERPSLNDFDWRFNAKLPRQACFELHTLKFIGEGGNALIIGKPGTGKSHVAKAVAYQATLQGFDVRYVEADTEFARYALGSTAEQAAQLRSFIEPDLVVLDDLFLARRISEASAELLQTVVHQRYKQRRSIIVTSNRVVQDWGKYLGDATMATTILDRLMHRAAMLEFEGKSYRLKEAASRIALSTAADS